MEEAKERTLLERPQATYDANVRATATHPPHLEALVLGFGGPYASAGMRLAHDLDKNFCHLVDIWSAHRVRMIAATGKDPLITRSGVPAARVLTFESQRPVLRVDEARLLAPDDSGASSSSEDPHECEERGRRPRTSRAKACWSTRRSPETSIASGHSFLESPHPSKPSESRSRIGFAHMAEGEWWKT